jgi:putative heme-binding domain-containing protein
LARVPKGVEALLKQSTENKFPAELKLTAAAALNAVQLPQYKDQIAALFPSPRALGGETLPGIAELAKEKGDAERGKALFAKAETTCITCHRVGATGVDFGPGLGEIGSKLGKEAIYEAILNPNAGISMGFETWQIQTRGGGSSLGIIRSETPDELVLVMPMGITNRLSKREISKRDKLPTSMMPSGLNQALSKHDLVDLVEYLASLKKP